jgi:hypothetical protein
MLKLKSLALALGAIAFLTTGMTAMAGSWPNVPARKTAQATESVPAANRIARQEYANARGALPTGDFEFVGGESGWQLRQHHYEFRGGGIAHAPDCTLVSHAAATSADPLRKSLEPTRRELLG